MKWNGMEAFIPEFGFYKSTWIVQKLNVDDHVISMVCSLNMCGIRGHLIVQNMLRVQVRDIRVTTLAHHVGLEISCLTDSNCFLLECLIRQSQRIVVHVNVYVHGIITLHSFIVRNRRLCWRHWRVSRCLFFSWEGSTSHLIIIIRSKFCKNVYPCVVWVKHSW